MKALLSVSFGTSYEETRVKTIDAIDAELAAAFPDRALYTAWTSGRILARIAAERGEHHDTLAEAFARMTADGVDDVIVATTCLMQGNEMGKIEAALDAWLAEGGRMARLAAPLLSTAEDRQEVARVLADEFAFVAEDEAMLFMGHGSETGDNSVYADMQDGLQALGRPRFFVATVEGTPVFDDAAPLIEASGAKTVHLAPLMIVAGDHANNDLAGDDEDSWASMLAARGYETKTHLRGLGEYAGIRALACAHARDAAVRAQ